MEYIVLARKLRPSRFADLVGQETVVRILQNAIQAGRVGHAFLFSGSRGVGKTTTARLLAKLLNCTQPKDGEPCNACQNCLEITANSSPDVIEIDAASNRGIDNIRELRENTRFSPAKCRYKTYIIDEVHMLTMESFNALLKTLEEPPPHIKFILATTAPHRLPETILSRCQRFDFPRIPTAAMVDYLAKVTQAEGLSIDRQALEAIAANSAGGMRDALTSIDQVVAYSGRQVGLEEALQTLGLMDSHETLALLDALLEQRVDGALEAFAAMVERGRDLAVMLEALLREIKDLALAKSLGGQNLYFQDHPPASLDFYQRHASRMSLDTVQQLFHLFLDLEGQLKRSQFQRACFEMALVKGCRVAPLVGVPELLEQVKSLLGRPVPSGGRGGRPAPSQPGPAATTAQPQQAPAAPAQTAPAPAALAAVAAPVVAASPTAVKGQPAPSGPARPSPARPSPAQPIQAPRASGPDQRTAPPAQREPRPPAAASPRAAAARPPEPPERDEAPLEPLPPALCDDPRWLAVLEAVRGQNANHHTLATLRRSEVTALDGQQLEITPADRVARGHLEKQLDALAQAARQALGPGVAVRLNHDTNALANKLNTPAERERLRALARRRQLRLEAGQDPAVARLLKFFPQGRVESVELPPEEDEER